MGTAAGRCRRPRGDVRVHAGRGCCRGSRRCSSPTPARSAGSVAPASSLPQCWLTGPMCAGMKSVLRPSLRLRPVALLLGGARRGSAGGVADRRAVRAGRLRNCSPGLPVRRCLALPPSSASPPRWRRCAASLPPAAGTGAGPGHAGALVVQALVFALMHLGNVPQAGSGDAAAMLVSVGLLGLLWGGVFAGTQPVGGGSAPCRMELHHRAQWRAAVR